MLHEKLCIEIINFTWKLKQYFCSNFLFFEFHSSNRVLYLFFSWKQYSQHFCWALCSYPYINVTLCDYFDSLIENIEIMSNERRMQCTIKWDVTEIMLIKCKLIEDIIMKNMWVLSMLVEIWNYILFSTE